MLALRIRFRRPDTGGSEHGTAGRHVLSQAVTEFTPGSVAPWKFTLTARQERQPNEAGENRMNIIRKAVLATALGAATLTAASPAMADGYRRGGDTTGAAIAGGVIGLALGAAIASGSRDRDYDGYYARPAPRYRATYVYRDYPRYYPAYPVYRDDWRPHEYRERRDYRRGW
jgi:hypothetical protein